MRPCIVFTTLPILDNFGNKCHLRGAQRNTVIQRSRALPSRSSRTSLCIRHCLVSGIHMIFIRHVMRSSGGCSSGGGSSGGSSSGWPKEIKFIKSNEIKFLNSTSWQLCPQVGSSLYICQQAHCTGTLADCNMGRFNSGYCEAQGEGKGNLNQNPNI